VNVIPVDINRKKIDFQCWMLGCDEIINVLTSDEGMLDDQLTALDRRRHARADFVAQLLIPLNPDSIPILNEKSERVILKTLSDAKFNKKARPASNPAEDLK
jgi:hypothetical protein